MNMTNSTTFRGYCLYTLAEQEVDKRKAARHAAFLALRKQQNIENATTFLQADKAVEDAEKLREKTRMMMKHNKRMS